MRKLLTVFMALASLSLIAFDAEARRMGGGSSIGKQRALNPNQTRQALPPQKAAPAQQQQPAQQPSGASKWLGPLAGLAIGAALASLFFNNGFAGALMAILLMLALVAGAVMLFRLFRGGRPAQQPLRYAGPQPHGGIEPVLRNPTPAPAMPAPGAAPHSVAAAMGSATAPAADPIAGFDTEQFLRHARANFTSLQAAHDRKDLSAIRDFLTPELYREIEADVRASGDTPQKTDIVTLNADVADVTVEGDLYVVSVRFSGLIREESGAEAQPFSEIWHLEKPTSGRSGWLVSGIQQA
jgi:predicted lipid-binding transport protein (Tim44 family)